MVVWDRDSLDRDTVSGRVRACRTVSPESAAAERKRNLTHSSLANLRALVSMVSGSGKSGQTLEEKLRDNDRVTVNDIICSIWCRDKTGNNRTGNVKTGTVKTGTIKTGNDKTIYFRVITDKTGNVKRDQQVVSVQCAHITTQSPSVGGMVPLRMSSIVSAVGLLGVAYIGLLYPHPLPIPFFD